MPEHYRVLIIDFSYFFHMKGLDESATSDSTNADSGVMNGQKLVGPMWQT